MFGVLCFSVLLFEVVVCVTNFPDSVVDSDNNIIKHDERRGADSTSVGSSYQELRSPSSYSRSRFYVPPTFDASGAGPTSFGSNTQPNAYLPPYYTPSSGSTSQSGSFGSTHGYGFYPDTGYNTVRGPSSNGPATTQSGYGSYALKGLLIPLAGIALLGAAAALSTNPVLLQLGVLNGRRKRSLDERQITFHPVKPNIINNRIPIQ